ncbi:MAG: glycosyltransferase family 4 protein [Gaiellaceae bacterium MAG52_C11]|nr:glycosyltransferase family 4 protein [Candidatus Gaiellasilicea maunaloa]
MVGNRTGQGRHIEYLAFEWSRMDIPFDRVLLLAPRPFELPELGSTTEIVADCFGARLPLVVWEQLALPWRARNASVLFCPTYIGPMSSLAPVVVANHGIYERIPDEFSRAQRLRSTTLHHLSARRARRVIANSRNTRTDVTEFFGVPLDKIDVVNPAANNVFFEEQAVERVHTEIRRVLGAVDPYFIFVGKLSRRRHLPELIEAFSIVRKNGHPTQRLLIVGPNAMQLDVAGVAREHGVADAVTYLPHLDQDALALLYAGADAFVLPTTYEGISQTMFEAMASGTAVLTVEHPTLEEGAGDTVLALRTPSVVELVDGMRRLLGDDHLRESLANQGRRRARKFSWTATARSTVEILDCVARPADRRKRARRDDV